MDEIFINDMLSGSLCLAVSQGGRGHCALRL